MPTNRSLTTRRNPRGRFKSVEQKVGQNTLGRVPLIRRARTRMGPKRFYSMQNLTLDNQGDAAQHKQGLDAY